MFTLEQTLLSIAVNGAALIVVFLLKSAPPRMVLYVCIAGMLAILVPWSYIGTGIESHLPSNALIGDAIISPSILNATAMPLGPANNSMNGLIVMAWLLVGITWLAWTILQSARTKMAWRSTALCGDALVEYANPALSKALHRARIYRIPNSSSAFATGLWRPEIWIGDDICSDSQLETALNHELAHIAANDQLTLYLIVALERLLWWNPLVWLLGRQARHQMEYACDAHCQSLIGATTYRHSLAELFLVQQPQKNSLELTLGNKSDITTRLEKIGMTHSTKPNHILALMLAGSLTAIASVTIAAPTDIESPTLMRCHELLPEGVQYDFKITSAIDTREGRKGELSVSLVDAKQPDSREIPNGAGDFIQCVQKVVGVGEDNGWPKS